MDKLITEREVPELAATSWRARKAAIVAIAVAITLVAAGCAPQADRWAIADTFAARYDRFAVAADHPVASAAGAEILAAGGNAVDAAVAVSFCLSVVRPYSCGIGGGGFMLVHVPAQGDAPAQTFALDYRETAPAAVGPEYYAHLAQPEASRIGVHAAGVPGTVAGLLSAHERWGRLDRSVVLAPAIRAAREGYALDPYAIEAMEEVRRVRAAHPELVADLDEVWRVFCAGGEQRIGDRHRNPDLAHVLEAIAQDGADAFYRGEIAERLAAFVQERGGALTTKDLDDYRPVVRRPLHATVRIPGEAGGSTALTMPPPSSGGVAVLQMLGMWERLALRDGAPRSKVDRLHLLAEVMQHAFADRAAFLADPDFVAVPVEMLLAPNTLDGYVDRVDPARTLSAEEYGQAAANRLPDQGGGTSHFSVIDAEGMAVSCTETVNLLFGSMMVVPGLGFPLNNEMDDFTTQPGAINAFGLVQSDANLPAPGKRPLSSMTPTIVLDEAGRVRAVLGASGGPRIITGTLQVLIAGLIDGLDPEDAMLAPRMHHQWMPQRIDLEPGLRSATIIDGLEERGHETGARGDIAHVQAIFVRPDAIHAVSDPRKGGRPAGR